MDLPVRPADALAQPTRARVFALLSEVGRPVTTDALAERLGLHPNGVRVHLERMLDAGLVERRRERMARGRPRDTWMIGPDAQPGGDPPTGYAALARWLVRSLVASEAQVCELEATGRSVGRALAADHAGEDAGEQLLFDTMTSLGFRPERERVGRDRLTYRLRNCPYREAVRERQGLVCGLHRGLTTGLLESIDSTSTIAGFEAKDPDLAGCMVSVQGPIAEPVPPVT